ncbi:pseudaminic acid synthase [Kiloniella antarctica]|uniref:Pseudaminic acid synthase n=1 Tax=Kiloniella antarctica TaxID=1550907 RepID=A0ABW5BQ28_9PROT
MSDFMYIDGQAIGPGYAPYVIAELSGNHNGEIERAFKIMEAAKKSGANAIKLQTYTSDTMTIDHDGPGFVVDLPLWKGRTLYDLYQEAHTPWDWHEALFSHAKKIGITIFSSPFDATAVDLLEKLGAPAYKVASFENIDIPLIKKISNTKKPLIISTGMASLEEIEDAVQAARDGGCEELCLLHCVSSYPASIEETNLANISRLREKFGVIVGLSDHSLGTVVPIAASAVGASVIEKHFTLSRDDGGVDSTFSLEPDEMRELVDRSREAAVAVGQVKFGPKPGELESLNYRRSLYVVEDVKAGEIFTPKNIRSIRPAHGLEPKYYEAILCKKASCDIKRGEPMTWNFVDRSEL